MNATIAPSKTELAPRSDQTYTPTKSYCDIFSDAKCDAINNGISYLFKVVGSPSEGPGPGACARVSCSYKSAIWWCNDVRKLLLSMFPCPLVPSSSPLPNRGEKDLTRPVCDRTPKT